MSYQRSTAFGHRLGSGDPGDVLDNKEMITLTEIRELNISVDSAETRSFHMAAASGLECINSTAYVVADDELHLGVFSTATSEPGYLIRLFDGVLPDGKVERKRHKPDLEALTRLPAFENFPHGALLSLGSGSTRNRGRGALLRLDTHGVIYGPPLELSMSSILSPLHQTFAELNIEGAVVAGDELRLFQRGNNKHPQNAIIRYPLSQALDAMRIPNSDPVEPATIDRLDLGFFDGVPLCFTDAAALPNGDMVFCAVAEDTDDAYHDGTCIGAAIGIVLNNGHLHSVERLDRPYKVEGISARLDGNRLDLLLVTDADDRAVPAKLLSTSMASSSLEQVAP